jgi:hypothetical protein
MVSTHDVFTIDPQPLYWTVQGGAAGGAMPQPSGWLVHWIVGGVLSTTHTGQTAVLAAQPLALTQWTVTLAETTPVPAYMYAKGLQLQSEPMST